MRKLKEAIVSFEEARETEDDVYTAPIAVGELHEFLAWEEDEPAAQSYELRAMYAQEHPFPQTEETRASVEHRRL